MFEVVNDRLNHDGVWTQYYNTLSRLAHPSPGMAADFYSDRISYKHDPAETKRFMWVAAFGYTNFLKHAVPYAYRDPAAAEEYLSHWNDQVLAGWPDFFGGQGS